MTSWPSAAPAARGTAARGAPCPALGTQTRMSLSIMIDWIDDRFNAMSATKVIFMLKVGRIYSIILV